MGDAEIEEVPVQDKHKVWIDEVSSRFGFGCVASLARLRLCSVGYSSAHSRPWSTAPAKSTSLRSTTVRWD